MDTSRDERLAHGSSALSGVDVGSRLRFRGCEARARQAEKRCLVLSWLQRFGSTDQSIIARLIGIRRSTSYKTIGQLESDGLIQPVPVDGCVSNVYILTQSGRAEAEVTNGPHLTDSGMGWCEVWARAPIHPSKLPLSHVQHDHLVQHVALDLINCRQSLVEEAKGAGFVVDSYGLGIDDAGFDFVPSRTIQKFATRDVGVMTKVPDLVFGLGLGTGIPRAIVAVEVQQTHQPPQDAEVDISCYAQEMGERGSRLFQVIYASTRPVVLDYYRQLVTPRLGFWTPKFDGKGYFRDTSKPTPATPGIMQRFVFTDLSHLHKTYYPGR